MWGKVLCCDPKNETSKLVSTGCEVPRVCISTVLGADNLEWSLPQITSLYFCLWPYVLAAIAALWVLHGGWKASRRLAYLRSVEERAGSEYVASTANPL